MVGTTAGGTRGADGSQMVAPTRSRSARARLLVSVLACVLLLAVAACSSSSSGTSSAGNGSSSTKTITVMTVTSWDNPEVDLQDIAVTGQVAANWINAHGGVHGASIKVIQCNDLFTASGAAACGRLAVSDNVAALVGGLSVFDGSILPIIAAAQIPWIGEVPFETQGYTSTVSFPLVSGEYEYTTMSNAAALSCKRVALVDAGQGSAEDIPYINAGMKAAGKSFVAQVSVTATSPDYSVIAAQLKPSDPDCIVAIINAAEITRLVPALEQDGVSSSHIYSDGIATPGILKSFPTASVGWIDTEWYSVYTSPAWADYRAAIDAAKIPQTYPNGQWATSGDQGSWASFQVLDKVASTISGTIHGAALIKALDSTSNLDTNGLTPLLSFTTPNSSPAVPRLFNTKSVIVKIGVGGALTQVGGFVNGLTIYNKGQ
jgi:ABC-type branched-subunit amino acid transport system substrate-binding protein